ncbi:DUF2059 domain-containing protein [Shimia litoralis]|uniref:DUF2059 domain-containing protein n=1 Tax=Shimia litoralis TaxID=420403 RepID=A0A4U7MWH3_9RHOB|nr:DUF2059 domain-containing protein [Shimia litoralis]TKZ17499.1 DUF2059 domain-containing protein [Shimia litoralis]
MQRVRNRAVQLFAFAVLSFVMLGTSVMAADRASVAAFLKVTGFDVAIDSIALSASSAPDMLGMDASDFGLEWTRLANDVFQPELMQTRATDILEQTLSDDMLAHAATFYASDLGQRLVDAENASHFEEDAVKYAEGEKLVTELMAENRARIDMLKRMNQAIDPNDIGPQAIQEIQVRFILAAAYAGLIELRIDEDGLRAALAETEPELLKSMEESALANSAYTYQNFTDAEILAYTEALEDPEMQLVYELMNAVHFEVMLNRFEVLAVRMADMQPAQDL